MTVHPGASPHAAYDASNNLMFITSDWCKFNPKINQCDRDDAALALTSLFAKADGHIVDADIEVNAAMDRILWMNADTSAKPGAHDLQNTLTHEMGHFLGFNHTCYTPGERRPRSTDNLGMVVGDCAVATEAIQRTTMFAATTPGETDKRMLKPEDILGVCEAYPLSLDPKICEVAPVGQPADNCGCSMPAGPPPLAAALLTVALATLFVRRRRQRRDPAQNPQRVPNLPRRARAGKAVPPSRV
jgi:MYXO-CTERM domain-containing protein